MSDLDVLINPPEILASALQPALGIALETPIGREIIQGMDYESGSWTENGNTYFIHHRFTKQHKNPPVIFLVHAASGQLTGGMTYGELFVNYLKLLHALQITTTTAKYGLCIYWTTGSSPSSISQSVTNITSKSGLDSYATNEYFQFGSSSMSTQIKNGKKYSWIAIWMPE